MKKFVTANLLILISIGFSAAAYDVPEQCLQNLSRVDACPNLVYRGINDPISNQRQVFCFCKTDFDLLLNEDVNDRQKILNRMDWQALLAATGYSDEQLKTLVKP